MKKICYVTTISATLTHFVLESAIFLHKQTGWDITFICNYDEEFEKSLPHYIHYIPIKMKRGVSLSGILAILHMIKLFRQEKFDLVQYSTPNASLYAAIAAFLARVPVRLYCQWGMVYVGFNGVRRKIFKLFEKLVCKASTCIEPDSFSNLKFAHTERLYPENKGTVIMNGSACGIDFSKFDISKKELFNLSVRKQLNIPENAFVFGFVGRLKRDKGVNELFEAYRNITSINPNIFLIIIGQDEENNQLNKDIYNWIKSHNQVRFIKFTNIVEQYLSAMDCFILPSYREGFGMVVVEAEAMGVPVIVSNIPGPIDAMVDNYTGIIVEKKDVKALTAAMTRVFNDDKLRNSLAINACSFARENFDRNKFFSHLLADRNRLLKL